MKKLLIIILFLFPYFCFSQTDMNSEVECIEDYTSFAIFRSDRDNSRLTVGCTYRMTYTFVGCLGQVEMYFKAVDVNEVSQNVTVTKGTLNFKGRYDLDQSTVGWLELEDDRGNEVEGHNAIVRFPWESTRVINTKVGDNSTWTCDCFPNYNHYDNRHIQDSNVNTVGATGYIYQTTFENEARPVWTNSFLQIDGSNYSGNFACDCDNAINYTSLRSRHNSSTHDFNGGNIIYFNEFDTQSNAIIRNDGAEVRMYYGSANSAYLRFRDGTVQLYYSDFDSYAQVDKLNTGLTYMYMMNLSSRIRLYNSTGALPDRHYYSTYTSYSDLDIRNTDFYGVGNQLDSRANIDFLNCTNADFYYNNFNSLARGEFNDNTGLTYIYGNHVAGTSEMRIEDNNNGRFYYSRAHGNSLIRIVGGANVQVNSCSLDNSSRQYYSAGNNVRNATNGYAYLYAHTNGNTITSTILLGRLTKTTTVNQSNRTSILGVISTNPIN